MLECGHVKVAAGLGGQRQQLREPGGQPYHPGFIVATILGILCRELMLFDLWSIRRRREKTERADWRTDGHRGVYGNLNPFSII